MIKNVLFDMGSVLVSFDPVMFTMREELSEEDSRLIHEELFKTIDWMKLDRGVITDSELLSRVKPRFPERLWPVIEKLITRWDEPPVMVEGMYDLVRELSEKGYGLYLLSNAAIRHQEYWPRYPVSEFFGDRLFISYQYKILKPDPRFYETAIEKFGLNKDECIFIDDLPLNAEGAVYCGIDALVFKGEKRLRKELREKGIDI